MHLPPELRDFVIDSLQDDRAALYACSLTCRSWLPCTRTHLFRTVQIEPGRRGAAFRALLEANPELGKYMRNVEILGIGQDIPVEHVVRMEWPTLRLGHHNPPSPPPEQRCVSWLENVLPKSTKLLRRVASLTVVAMHIHPELVEILSRHFSAIRTLAVNKCRSATFADFIALPRAFFETRRIQIHEIHWLRPTQPPATLRPRPHKLTTLVLSPKTDVALMLTWLVAQNFLTSLQLLSCYSSGHNSAIAIRDLLKAVGSSLQHLSFGFSDVKDPTVLLQSSQLSLESCTGLRSLHIYCTNTPRFSSMPSLSWIFILLAKLNSSQLHELQFSIPASYIPALNLEGLTVVLSHSSHARLKRLIFNVILLHGDIARGVEQRILSRVCSLTANGLNVEVVSSDQCSRLIC